MGLFELIYLFAIGYVISWASLKLAIVAAAERGLPWTIGDWSFHIRLKVYSSVAFILVDTIFFSGGTPLVITFIGYIFRCAFVDIPAIDKTIKDYYANQKTQ